MGSDLLFVVGSLLAIGVAWIAAAVIRFSLNVQQTSRIVEKARWEAIAAVLRERGQDAEAQ